MASNETPKDAQMSHMTTQPNSYRPDPQDPFSLDLQPESLSVDMVELYSSLPMGVMEITHEGVMPIHGEALSLLDEEPRVFVVRHAGTLGLVKLHGPALDIDAANEYLTLFGRHVYGAHIREYGRLGAAVIIACIAFQRDMGHLSSPSAAEDNAVIAGKPARRCAFEQGILRIEVEQAPLDPIGWFHPNVKCVTGRPGSQGDISDDGSKRLCTRRSELPWRSGLKWIRDASTG
jgi:hypothetical protein